ncbi:hypothetical protein K461DRAFT_181487 [Myriangium duriaei CBS 260.36]|uniref:Uncharacterized protein n=1 Tax=Myriangium duriaei CBS 260.36 TaxID=1168546 RepID=A0A9P4MI81_9PEZI|nr:hypothetical protein K461DRAFT_181487 [Myriangium duriaei CBS 260.36]
MRIVCKQEKQAGCIRNFSRGARVYQQTRKVRRAASTSLELLQGLNTIRSHKVRPVNDKRNQALQGALYRSTTLVMHDPVVDLLAAWALRLVPRSTTAVLHQSAICRARFVYRSNALFLRVKSGRSRGQCLQSLLSTIGHTKTWYRDTNSAALRSVLHVALRSYNVVSRAVGHVKNRTIDHTRPVKMKYRDYPAGLSRASGVDTSYSICTAYFGPNQ